MTTTVEVFRTRLPEVLLRKCVSYLGGSYADWLNYMDANYYGIEYPGNFAAVHNLPELMGMYRDGLSQGDRYEEVAAIHGSVQVLDWLHKYWGVNPRAPQTCELAAGAGNQAACGRAKEFGYGWGITASAAVANGHADLLSWAIRAGAPYSWRKLMAAAAYNGDRPTLEVLLEHGRAQSAAAQAASTRSYEWVDEISMGAAAGGRREILKWLMEQGCPIGPRTMDRAAVWPGLVRWLREAAGCPWGADTAAITAKGGDLALFDWLYEQGCPLGPDTCIMAAASGSLKLFERAVARMENPWGVGAVVCTAAAAHGHLEILKRAHGGGAPVDEETMVLAASGGRREVVEYLCGVGCPRSADAHYWAGRNGHGELADWLRGKGGTARAAR